MMVTNTKDYVKDDDEGEDDYKDSFGYYYRDRMIAQFKQDLYNKSFILQDQGKGDENDTLQKIFKFLVNFIDMGGPIPDNVYDYDHNNPEINFYFQGSGCNPELRESEKFLIMTQKSIKIIINEIYSDGPKKNYVTNETDVYHFDDIWSWIY